MAEKVEARTNIRNFSGQYSGVDPDDTPEGGAQEQVNAIVNVTGQLIVRGGYRLVAFDDD